MDEQTLVEEKATEFGPGATGDGRKEIPRPTNERAAAVRRVAEAEDEDVVVDGVDGGKARVKRPAVSEADAEDATVWLLQSFADELEPAQHTLKLNVGSLSKARWIKWRIQAVRREVIDKLRDETLPSQNRAMRRGGASTTMQEQQNAQWKLDIKLVLAGTVEPDLRAAVKSTGFADAEAFVEDAFKFNSGLVSIISNSILTLSGYDEDNVQDQVEGAAAGN